MVSIIIPIHNRQKTIERAIQSVLDQTYNHFEIVVVDDCSTDDSSQIVAGIDDSRIRLLRLSQNVGAGAARNYGVKQAQGDLIAFLDSDDYYEKEFLEESIKVLADTSSEVGFMWTGIRFHHSGEKLTENSWEPIRLKNSFLTFLNEIKIGSGSGITVKKEVFDKCGLFDETLPAAEDTEFFFRVTQIYDYKYSTRVLINIDKTGIDRMSMDFTRIGKAYNTFLPKYFDIIDRDEILQKKFYYKMMWLNYHLGNEKKARNFFRKIPGSKVKIKALIIKFLYESFPLQKASSFHQKISSF